MATVYIGIGSNLGEREENCGKAGGLLLENGITVNKMSSMIKTEPWGVKVSKVEIKEIDLPDSMQRAMAKQAEAERERRAAVINASGELEAAAKLSEAAALIGGHPTAIRLRYLQTIREIGVSDQNSTIIPIPMELFTNIFQPADKQ